MNEYGQICRRESFTHIQFSNFVMIYIKEPCPILIYNLLCNKLNIPTLIDREDFRFVTLHKFCMCHKFVVKFAM